MATSSQDKADSFQEFVELLSEVRGIVEVKAISDENGSWIGLRTGRSRPAPLLLHQVSRAADGFGLDTRTIHFGILAD